MRVVSYTKEGDPIISDLSYNGEILEVTRDTSRDNYGDNTIKTHQCKTIEVIKNKNNQDEYVLTGCSGNTLLFRSRKEENNQLLRS
ncbi:DUF4362 domain-containing protein [Peribacillus deserti]|uniref:DUF4362 domain-containing protein n=1 Tax=Peribacillus deserti TaxID=673318 RepID=UPI00363E33A4